MVLEDHMPLFIKECAMVFSCSTLGTVFWEFFSDVGFVSIYQLDFTNLKIKKLTVYIWCRDTNMIQGQIKVAPKSAIF